MDGDYIKPTVDLIVETNDEGITEVSYNRLTVDKMFYLAVWIVGWLEYHTGIPYNKILDDLKEEIETEETQEEGV